MHFNNVLSNFSVISVFTEIGFFLRLHCQFTDINISGQCSKKHANSCLFLNKEFAELQIRLFCVEDMSPEPSKLITALESKVPFFKGHGLGVTCMIPNFPPLGNIFRKIWLKQLICFENIFYTYTQGSNPTPNY